MNNVCKLNIALLVCFAAHGQAANSYTVTNLTSDVAGMAANTDPNLKNPWGLSRAAGSPWWVSDNNTGLTTLYNESGTPLSLVVTIPSATGTGTGSPTGTVFVNGTFDFVTLDGTVQTWTGGASTVIKVSNPGAPYTGLTSGKVGTSTNLYVANNLGTVEVYDATTFARVTTTGTFTDPKVPLGYWPYGIQSVGSLIYVTWTNGGAGKGIGYLSAFDTSGNLKLSFKHGTFMNSPWGIAKAPKTGFGQFSNRILVGMQGSGQIAAFNATTGAFLGLLHQHASTKPIAIPGLWAIYFGGGNTSDGPKNSLFFAAGINNYADGLFGSITAP